MKFRVIFVFLLSCFFVLSACKSNKTGIEPLAQDGVVVYDANDLNHVNVGTPAIVCLESGRMVLTIDQGGAGVAELPGEKNFYNASKSYVQGKILTSDDHGKTWTVRGTFPYGHARPFVSGSSIYILGQCQDLMIMRSDDNGESWSKPVQMTQNETWHASACNVWYANDCIYLVMEKRFERGLKECWRVGDIAPILMRAKVGDDLLKVENWTFASPLVFQDVVKPEDLEYFGVPFFTSPADGPFYPAPNRGMSPIGWLETNVVQFTDPSHLWTDPSGHTFHLFMRAHTGGTGYAALAKVVEQENGEMITQIETVPSGKKLVFVPFPGGQMKFYVLYDEITKLYWMVGTQATDSMIRIDKMPEDRYNLPNNERRRMVLHFSKNMIDWCFAGVVAIGPVEHASRHYPSMAVDGENLVIVSRSGDENASSAHDCNLITCHTVKNFRELVY